MRGATSITLPNLTKYCACHAKWLSWLIFVTYETSITMRGATGITLQPHQILRLPRKSALQNLSKILRERLKRQFQCAADSTMIRTWSEHDPTMIRPWSEHELVISHPPVRRGYFSRFGDAFCIENYNISRSGYLLKFHRILRLPRKVTLQPHQMLLLPRKMMRIIDCRRIWNVIYTMRRATGITLQPHQILCLPRKSALQNLSEILRERLKRQFQCAADSTMIRTWSEHDPTMIRPWSEHELVISHPPVRRGYFSRSGYLLKFHRILRLPRKVTLQPHQMLLLPRKMMRIIDCRRIWNVIYNAQSNRHHPPTSPNTAPATQKCTPKSKRNSPRTVEAPIPMRGRFDHDPNMIRTWSDHDPSMNSSSRTRPFVEVTFRASETHFVLKITTFRAPAIYSNFTEYCACHEKWPSNLTKCCSCHEKGCASLIVVAYETSFTMRRATGITLQPHQILRLPRKSALQNLSEILRERLKRQFQCAADSTMIRPWSDHDPTMIRAWTRHLAPARSSRLLFALRGRILYWKLQHFALRLSTQISPNTAPATKSDTPTSPNTAPATKNDTPTSPNAAPATKGDTPTSPNTAPATKSETVTELLLNWAVTKLLLSCY